MNCYASDFKVNSAFAELERSALTLSGIFGMAVYSSKTSDQSAPDAQVVKVPKITLITGVLVLIALIIFVYFHVGDAKRFVQLAEQAEPKWLILIVGLQVSTYVCVGLVWNRIMRSSGYKISLREMTRLSVEKLSIDQLIPAVGISGNIAVFQAMKRLGVPRALALEAILVNLLARYVAYAVVAVIAVLALVYFHDITPVLLYLVGLFSFILVLVPLVIIWLLAHQGRDLPAWMKKIKPLVSLHDMIAEVDARRIYSVRLLLYATVFNLFVFLLDSATLWAVLQSIGISTAYLNAFIAVVMAYMAATLSLLPGGIGGFEAGCVAMLTKLGVPLEAALTGTVLLRGFTLWLPLIPGLIFARRDVIMKV